MLKLPKCTLFIILLWSLTSCATKPPDIFVFEKLEQHLSLDAQTGHLILKPSPACMTAINEPECGHGVSIVTGRQIFIGEIAPNIFNGQKWSELQEVSVILPAKESYAPLATYIINSCKQANCNTAIDAFRIKLDSLKSIKGVIMSAPDMSSIKKNSTGEMSSFITSESD